MKSKQLFYQNKLWETDGSHKFYSKTTNRFQEKRDLNSNIP